MFFFLELCLVFLLINTPLLWHKSTPVSESQPLVDLRDQLMNLVLFISVTVLTFTLGFHPVTSERSVVHGYEYCRTVHPLLIGSCTKAGLP